MFLEINHMVEFISVLHYQDGDTEPESHSY